MPNWASNDVVFASQNKELLKKLYEEINHIIKNPITNGDCAWEYVKVLQPNDEHRIISHFEFSSLYKNQNPDSKSKCFTGIAIKNIQTNPDGTVYAELLSKDLEDKEFYAKTKNYPAGTTFEHYDESLYNLSLQLAKCDNEEEIDGNVRGYLCGMEEEITEIGNGYFGFHLFIDSAWDFCSGLIKALERRSEYDNIDILYTCEECGNGVFDIHDPEGLVFTYKYYIDTYGIDELEELDNLYFDTEEELLDSLNEVLGTSYSSIQEIDEEEIEEKYEDAFFRIREYEQV